MLKDDWVSGDSFTAADQNDVANAVNQIVNNVKAFGASGNGIADDTDAIQDALAAGGITFFPGGTYLTTGLVVPNGAYLTGVGFGSSALLASVPPASQRSVLKLKNSSDANVISIADDAVVGTIEHLEVDGNKANNASGHGIYFEPFDAVTTATIYRIVNCEIHDCSEDGLNFGGNRGGLYTEDLLSVNNDGHGINIWGTDTTHVKSMTGANGGNNIDISASQNRFIGGDCWGSGASAIHVSFWGVAIEAMGIDGNQHHGILIDGTDAPEVRIIGCSMRSNSLATDNTYSDICVVGDDFSDTAAISIVGNTFANPITASPNKRKYAIQTGGNVGINAVGNTHIYWASGTGYTDHPELLNDWTATSQRITFKNASWTEHTQPEFASPNYVFNGSSPATFTVPDPGPRTGATIRVKNAGSANVSVPNVYTTTNATVTVAPGGAVTLISDEFSWHVIALYAP